MTESHLSADELTEIREAFDQVKLRYNLFYLVNFQRSWWDSN